ncbi:MAG: hypothetical protein ACYC6Y_10490 [Thermoguttaceae bacterium]
MATRFFFAACGLLLLGLAPLGCKRPLAPAASPTSQIRTADSPASAPKDLAMLRYDTGDVEQWPDYHFPLEHSFDVPEVPPEIIGPFSEEVIPAPRNEAPRQ